MREQAVKSDFAARWEEMLVQRAFLFLWVGFLTGGVTFGYLFVPQDGTSWVHAWGSRGGAWAIVGWLFALVLMSCGVRGIKLRVYRWRRERESMSAEAAMDDDASAAERASR